MLRCVAPAGADERRRRQLDFTWARTRLFDEAACLAFYQRCVRASPREAARANATQRRERRSCVTSLQSGVSAVIESVRRVAGPRAALDADGAAQVETKDKSKWRPLPLTTVAMQKLASDKLKIVRRTSPLRAARH